MATVLEDSRRHYQAASVYIVLGMALGTTSYAYSASIIQSTLGQPTFNEYMGLATNPNAEGLIGSMTGLFYAGGCFGCLMSAVIADRFGRKWAVITGLLVEIIATGCLAGSVNIAMFLVFRFFVGWGAYMLFLTVPLWVTELVPPKGRSILAGIIGASGCLGYILASYVGVGFFYYAADNSVNWRVPLALGCVPALLSLATMPFLPESPRFLLSQDRNEEAWAIVRRLHTTPGDRDHEYAKAEFFQMRKQHEIEKNLDSSWSIMLKRPSYRKRVAIAMFLPFVLYSCGTLVVATYAATLFTSLGYDAGQSLELLAGTVVGAIVGNIISLLYVDRVPRNVMLGAGALVVSINMSIETALTSRYLGTDNKAGLSAAAAFLFIFQFIFNLFCEGPSQYYTSEIFPTHLRAKGMTINVVTFCLIDILWLELAPTAFGHIGWKYYLVFCVLGFFGSIIIFTTFPDTLRKPLEEVARLFGDEDLVGVYQEEIPEAREKQDNVEIEQVQDEQAGI